MIRANWLPRALVYRDAVAVTERLNLPGTEQVLDTLELASAAGIVRLVDWQRRNDASQAAVPQSKAVVVLGENNQIADAKGNAIHRVGRNLATCTGP